MKTEEIKTLKIELDGDDSDRFKAAIKKIHEQESRAGFNNTTLSAEEKVLIKSINEKLNP